MRLAEIQDTKSRQKSLSGHQRNMVNFGPLAAEIGSGVWGTLQISTGFASWRRYCTVLQQWASAKLCDVEQRAPPVFGRAIITLGVGPHLVLLLLLWPPYVIGGPFCPVVSYGRPM